MFPKTIADRTFGTSSQARALLELLSNVELDMDKSDLCRTFPVYRGREGLIAIQAKLRGSQHSIVVLFGEHKSSDDILVEHYTCDYELNPPSPQVFELEGTQTLFPYGSLRKAQDHIEMLLETFAEFDEVPAPKTKKSSTKKVKTR